MSRTPPPRTDDVVIVKPSPLNAETPAHALAAEITPTAHVYVRSNFPTPPVHAGSHRITVVGAVRAPLVVTMDGLRALPSRTVVATMECAGNDRSFMRPLPPGELWQSGAVSTARWSGVPLSLVLERAGINSDAVEILVEGTDAGPRDDAEQPGPVAFARALPLADAVHPDTLLALMMNDEPLRPEHGAPVRLVAPGWYGMASVKWVARIEARTTPFGGYFQTRRYVYDDGDGVTAVTRARVKSLIVSPVTGAQIPRAPARVWGWAWSGAGAITRVEVAVDGGDTWRDARVHAPASPHAWTRWEIDWEPRERGRYALRSRATDAAGAVQPDAVRANRLGYGNNAVQAVIVDVC